MDGNHSKSTKKPYLKVLLYGLLSGTSYALVFTHEAFVREVWAKGGIYAVLPIITVFVFSFVHGNFADNFMASIGIVAKKK